MGDEWPTVSEEDSQDNISTGFYVLKLLNPFISFFY